MKRAKIGIALAVVFLALPVAANAPLSPPSEKQYDDFTSDSQRITDRFTNLVWERNASGGLVSFTDATAFCNRGTNPPTRVPTLKELLTLVDEEPNPIYDTQSGQEIVKMIDLQAFRTTPVDAAYWSSSIDPQDGRVFTVDFKTGTTRTESLGLPLRVRCVQALP